MAFKCLQVVQRKKKLLKNTLNNRTKTIDWMEISTTYWWISHVVVTSFSIIICALDSLQVLLSSCWWRSSILLLMMSFNFIIAWMMDNKESQRAMSSVYFFQGETVEIKIKILVIICYSKQNKIGHKALMSMPFVWNVGRKHSIVVCLLVLYMIAMFHVVWLTKLIPHSLQLSKG